jgi:hypothetical protein
MTTTPKASDAAAATVPPKDAAAVATAESNTEATSKDTSHSNTNGTAAANAATTTSFYEEPEHLKKLCDFLRSRHGLPVREALLMEKRVHYLKGTSVHTNVHRTTLDARLSDHLALSSRFDMSF